MRSLLVKLAFVVLMLMPMQAMADTTSRQSVNAAPVSHSAIPGRPSLAEGSLLQRVQGSYCRGCRLNCIADRNECYDYEPERQCRRQFSRCMKSCWNRYCR